jgi:hypothetical protein
MKPWACLLRQTHIEDKLLKAEKITQDIDSSESTNKCGKGG